MVHLVPLPAILLKAAVAAAADDAAATADASAVLVAAAIGCTAERPSQGADPKDPSMFAAHR